MELLLLAFLLLPFTVLPVETVSEWKPLENAPEDFTLSLSFLSWCGESRAFMSDFRELISNEPSLETLQLRYVDAKTSPASRKITIYHKGGAYSYSGTFSPAYVLASLLHLLSTDPDDRPFHSLHSAEELQDFISSTDTAVVLADFCGWTLGKSREEETVESNETELFSSFQVKEAYDVANQTTSQCSSTERQRFEAFYSNLTELANLNVLTPFYGRFGVVTSVQVLEDAGVAVPPEEPWLLLARSQELIPSWRTLDDPSRLNEFLTDLPSVVHELTRDSELPSDRPSVLVFLQRGHLLKKKHDESLHALSVFREVARYFWSSKLPANVKSNESRSVKETVKTVYVRTLDKELDGLAEQLTDLLHLFLQDGGNASRQGDRNSTGVSNLTEELGKQASNRKRSVYFGLYDGADALQESFTGKVGAGPSVVAFFPDRESYYVYPDDAPVSFSPLVEFLEEALAGSLKPFVRSGPAPSTPREGVMPPFVNLDFRPVQPVPPVTVESFSELVLGTRRSLEVNESYESVANAAWETNTLVLFTQTWCGFCKRMELVVREVYRSLNLASFPKEPKSLPGFETPAFYQMDCTENHCSSILGNILKVEEYPTVVLFPAQRKMQPVVFRDSPTVENIFRFIRRSMNRGTSSFHGLQEGFLPSTIRIEGEEQTESEQTKTRPPRLAEQASERSVTVGVGTVLLATDKLSNASSVFEKAEVLIISVTADHVMGLIINKPVQWTQLSSLDRSQLQTVTTAYIGFGGPIYEHPKHLFTCTRLQGVEGFTELNDGLHVAGPSPTERVFDLIEAHKLSPSDFRFYVGHCGWSVVQLQNELLTGYWDVTELHADTLGWEPESPTP